MLVTTYLVAGLGAFTLQAALAAPLMDPKG